MTTMKFKREDLRNGDLIGWRHIGPPNKSGFYLNLVRVATFSEYGHVSIVWNHDGKAFHVEATQPSIQHVEVPVGEAYVVPMGLNLNDSDMADFFASKLGLKYSFRDAVMGYLGMKPTEEDRYQCAELGNDFFVSKGIHLPNAYTPSRLMRQALIKTGSPLFYLNH